MKITNNTIEEIINVLNDSNSFRNNIEVKIPAKIRFAIRINEGKLNDLYKAYQDERVSMLKEYIEQGHATIENERIHIEPDFIAEANKELIDLANIETDIDFQLVDEETMNDFLNAVSLSVPEERILLMFVG